MAHLFPNDDDAAEPVYFYGVPGRYDEEEARAPRQPRSPPAEGPRPVIVVPSWGQPASAAVGSSGGGGWGSIAQGLSEDMAERMRHII